MRLLIATAGSHGDVFPYIAIGRELRARGHDALLFANPFFGDHAATAGLPFVPVGTVDDYQRLFGGLSESDPKRAMRSVASELATLCRAYYDAMRAHVTPGQTAAIGGSLLFAPRLLRETHGVPCAVVHLAPVVFRSDAQPARLVPHWITADSPALVKRVAWWLLDSTYYRPHFEVPLNRLRADLGLGPVTRIFRSWIHQADCCVALFPDWFAPPQPGWPTDAVLTGFPLYDSAAHTPLPRALSDFVDAGTAPVAFSAGTANANARSFFAASVTACESAGLRGILISHFPDHLPDRLPPNVMHVPYAPFGALLPRVGAFVHHGGIGTLSQALRAGVPQLIRPVAFDQFDNSARAVQIGVARELLAREYRPRAVAGTLQQLLSDTALRGRCQEVSARFVGTDPIGTACDAILARCRPAA